MGTPRITPPNINTEFSGDEFSVEGTPTNTPTHTGRSAQRSQFSVESFESLEKLMLQNDLPQMRQQMGFQSPRLAKVYAALDLALPSATQECAQFGDLVVRGAIEHSTSFAPNVVLIDHVANSRKPQDDRPYTAEMENTIRFAQQVVASSSKYADAKTELCNVHAAAGRTMARNQLIPLAMRYVIAKLDDAVLDHFFEFQYGDQDISPRAEAAILQYIEKQRLHGGFFEQGDKQSDVAFVNAYALAPSDADSPDESLKPKFQEFRSLASWFLIAEPAETKPAPRFVDTLLPGIQRASTMLPNDRSPWMVKTGQTKTPSASINDVISSVFTNACRHLELARLSALPAGERLYPAAVYESLAKALQVDVPHYLLEQPRPPAAHSPDEPSRSATDTPLETPSTHASRLQGQSDLNTVPIQHAFTPGAAENSSGVGFQVMALLEKTHHLQNVSGSRRTPGRGNSRVDMVGDNRCWLRSAWLSVFAQTAGVKNIKESVRAAVEREDLGRRYGSTLGAIAQAYLKSPKSLLHTRGENPEVDPAHFRGGEPMYAVLQQLDVPSPTLSPMHQPALSASIERELEAVAVDVASAFRQKPPCVLTKELNHLKSPEGGYSMATSDVALSLHRGLGLPCVVIEKKPEAGITVRIAAPKGHALDDVANNLLKAKDRGGVELADLVPLVAAVKDLPVLLLENAHFQVYLPNKDKEAPGFRVA